MKRVSNEIKPPCLKSFIYHFIFVLVIRRNLTFELLVIQLLAWIKYLGHIIFITVHATFYCNSVLGYDKAWVKY